MKETIRKLIKESVKVKEFVLETQIDNIEAAAKIILKSIKSGCKVLVFGNGGSASDSQHMAAEFVGRFKKERKAISAIALTTDTSILTALANDYGYAKVFSRQVEAHGAKGDVAIGISTSGNSENVIEAIKKARSMGLVTIGLLGGDGGRLKKECDIAIVTPSKDTPRIQESHVMIEHIICELVENEI